jgi:hypothetical protein
MTSLRLTLAGFGKMSVVAVLASSALLTVGCSNMETTATGTPLSSGAVLTGRVHGGNNPVAGGGVSLYAVGQTGVGSAPTLYAYTTEASDGTGSFNFVQNPGTGGPNSNPYGTGGNSYACPSGVAPMMYILAQGGNTTGNLALTSANNTAAAFLAPVGLCNQISNSTFVDVSEVTTAATVAAAAQFINPNTDGIGNDGIGEAYAEIANAFQTVPNLVSSMNGLATTTATIPGSGTGVGGVTMTVTPPTATLNTIANILSACVNQVSNTASNCLTLFSNATPPPNAASESQPTLTYGTADDTVKAALYMYLNPTDGSTTNRTNLFNLVAAAGAPYLPTLPSVPTDWLLAITYTASGTCGTGNSAFLSHPYDLNVDIGGNLWIANNAGTNSALVQMSPYGVAQNCQSLGGSSEGGGVIDINASIWYADNANSLIWTYPTNPLLGGSTRSFVSPAPPVAITTDGSGNIFFTTTNGTTGNLYEIVDGANVNTTSSPVLLTSSYNVGPNPIRMFPDAVNNIWVSSGAGYVTEFHQTGSATYAAIQYGVVGPTYGLTVGSSTGGNNVYVTSQDTNSTLTIVSPVTPGSTTYAVSFTSPANAGGLLAPTGISLDGAMNSWVANNSAESSGLYAVSELGSTGNSISPAGTNGGYQKPTTVLSGGRMSVVDPIGNVWILNDNLPNSVTQILGAAVPIYAPYSYGLQNGRFQTIP